MRLDEFESIMEPLALHCQGELTDELAELYAKGLADVPAAALAAAVGRYIAGAQDRWLPSIGQLRALAHEAIHGRPMHWSEAWERLQAAARVFCRHDEAKAREAHAMLTPELEKHVQAMGGFLTLTESGGGQLAVLQSNFRDAWSERSKRDAADRALPEPLRPRIYDGHPSAIEAVAERLGLPEDITR